MLTSFGGGLSVEVLSIRKTANETGESNLPSKRSMQNPKQPISCQRLADIHLPNRFPDCGNAILGVIEGCGRNSILRERRVKAMSMMVVVKAGYGMFPTLRHLPTWDSWVRETGKGGLKIG